MRCCYSLVLLGFSVFPVKATDLFQAIRANDCATVKRLVRTAEDANSRNANGATAMMYAALHSDVSCMKYLLEKGADPNAANPAGTTALIWAGGDLGKVKLLIEHGADVNARSKAGRTAIHVAARQQGTTQVLRLLLDKGAEVNSKDETGGTPLLLAAQAGDLEVVKLLVERGADIHYRPSPQFGVPRFGSLVPEMAKTKPSGNFGGRSALVIAANARNEDVVRFLLAKGAKTDETTGGNSTALHLAVQSKNPEIARMLLDAGADVNASEYRGATPLIITAATDDATPAMIRLLLDKGADPSIKDSNGRTAADWAATRGKSEIARMLGAEAANTPAAPQVIPARLDSVSVRQSVERSLELLLNSSGEFFRKSGCISCHHQSISQMAVASARERGFHVNEEAARHQNKATLSVFAPHRENLLQAIATVPASTIVSSYALVGLAAEGYPADDSIDAMVHELAVGQRLDGSWQSESFRPPLDHGNITGTVLTMRSLQLYALPGRRQEFERRLAKARQWLTSARGTSTHEKALRLLGLAWAKADAGTIQAAARELLAAQRADGGWAQLSTLESDAYATGQVLVALHEANALKSSSPVFQRGAAFLLATQKPDASWHVKSRALGFQPYFESGYPHGHDQWISAAGGAWATMALSLTTGPKRTLASR